jgi:hypothetical protein
MARPILRFAAQFTWLFFLLCAALAGCARATLPVVKQQDTSNLTTISLAYNRATDKLGRPPKDLDELKPHLKELGDPDAILRSPHDGQPYVILFGRNIRKVDVMPPPIIAYEQQGANGSRYVLTAMGVQPMSDEEFKKADVTKKP